MNTKTIKIFDTTLRDGQQCPGAGMSFENNIAYAHLASAVGVDILEAGFPAASATDFNIVKTIATEIPSENKKIVITALCQLRESQIDTTIQALEPAAQIHQARLHTYLPVDPHLMEASLGARARDFDQLIDDVYRMIRRATEAGMEVEFSPEGYSRMGENFDFVTDVIRAAITAGATVINCPDTIGGACKLQGKEYFVNKMQQHAAIIQKEFSGKNITWSVHCHNDFGLALENSMNAVIEGPATQIEGCFNGIGERAGNVALEQCILYLKHFDAGNTNIHIEKIKTICDFVDQHMLPRQPHWPITGDNAAKHSSGGHTNAVLKNPLAYQPFDPEEVGNSVSFLFGPLSGGNHAKAVIEKHGYVCPEKEKVAIAQFIKNHTAHRRKGITDQELIAAYQKYRKTQEKSHA